MDYRNDPIQRPHSNKSPLPPSSNVFLLISAPIIILKYGYVSTEVHLPLIAHKRTVMPHYKNSGLRLTFSTTVNPVLSGHRIKRTVAEVPKFISLIYSRPIQSNSSAIEPNRTPIVRLLNSIEHNRIHNKILPIEHNRTFDYRTIGIIERSINGRRIA